MKKEKYDYYDQFILMTKKIEESAKILKDTLDEFNNEKLEANSNRVHQIENEADKITHELENQLIKDFITPIDREDISLIGNRLDDIEDGIDEILINFKILNIGYTRDGIERITDLLVRCTSVVAKMCENLKIKKNTELVKEKVIEINHLEEEGDKIYQENMQKLYREEQNPIEIIKWTNIYKCFENTFDDCEKLGDFIDDVIMKNI